MAMMERMFGATIDETRANAKLRETINGMGEGEGDEYEAIRQVRELFEEKLGPQFASEVAAILSELPDYIDPDQTLDYAMGGLQNDLSAAIHDDFNVRY